MNGNRARVPSSHHREEGGCVINKISRSHRSRRSRGGVPCVLTLNPLHSVEVAFGSVHRNTTPAKAGAYGSPPSSNVNFAVAPMRLVDEVRPTGIPRSNSVRL